MGLKSFKGLRVLTVYGLRIRTYGFYGLRLTALKEAEMKNHKDLDVWQLSMDLVTDIYKLTCGFPKEELYGLSNQMRRAAVSVPSNIAEGAARNSKKEFNQFLHISLGSLAEVETQLIISRNLGFASGLEALLAKVDRVKKMLNGLIFHLKK
jgi:four helix bundle protein